MPKASRGKTTKTAAQYCDAIVDAYFIKGEGITEIARKRNMSKSTISNIVKRYREEGRVEYKPQGGVKNVKIKVYHSDFLRDLIDNEEDGSILTLDQLKFQLEQNFPEDFPNEAIISIEAVRRHIDEKLEFTLKRTRAIEERQLHDDVIERRKEHARKIVTGSIHCMDNCIFVDESGFNACMVPGRARSKKGKRSNIVSKTKRGLNISIIDVLSSTAIESLETRRKNTVMDNDSFHKSSIIQERFENSIHEACYLPPYSPINK